jgi:two-component system phosphate regulon sensor histidine kinase PhoR
MARAMSTDAGRVIDALPFPAMLVGRDDRIEAASPAATQLFGHDGRGRHYVTVLRQPAALDAIEATRRDGTPREAAWLGREGGRDTAWRLAVRALPQDPGRRVLVTFEDVTAMEEAGQIRRDFVANVSHELRTPLTSLLGFVETLRGPARADPAAQDRFLGIIEREARRMARLVDDLLSLSRVEAEERRRPTGSVDLAELARGVASALEPVAARTGARIELAAAESGPVVPGDRGQLGQVLTNLVENAIKYGGAGAVRVSVAGPTQEPALQRPGARIEVSDEGPGIAAHHLPRLTERFYRVDDHRSREVGGTGLGLAIVKHVVSRHRGRLRVESEVGRGSRFIVILPVA